MAAGARQRRSRWGGGVAATAVAAALVVGGCTDAEPAPEPTTTASVALVNEGPVAATELAAGDCFDDLVIGLTERITVDSVDAVDCNGEHDLEVFATFEVTSAVLDGLPVDRFPGRARIIRVAERGCNERLDEFEVDSDALGALSIWPTTASWGRGDRDVVCVLYRTDGEPFDGRQVVITGS